MNFSVAFMRGFLRHFVQRHIYKRATLRLYSTVQVTQACILIMVAVNAIAVVLVYPFDKIIIQVRSVQRLR